jgi:hypothetical protein
MEHEHSDDRYPWNNGKIYVHYLSKTTTPYWMTGWISLNRVSRKPNNSWEAPTDEDWKLPTDNEYNEEVTSIIEAYRRSDEKKKKKKIVEINELLFVRDPEDWVIMQSSGTGALVKCRRRSIDHLISAGWMPAWDVVREKTNEHEATTAKHNNDMVDFVTEIEKLEGGSRE